MLCSQINETKLSITSTTAGEKKSAVGISVYKHLFQLKYITLLLTLIKQTCFGSFLGRQFAAFIGRSQRISKVGEAPVEVSGFSLTKFGFCALVTLILVVTIQVVEKSSFRIPDFVKHFSLTLP